MSTIVDVRRLKVKQIMTYVEEHFVRNVIFKQRGWLETVCVDRETGQALYVLRYRKAGARSYSHC